MLRPPETNQYADSNEPASKKNTRTQQNDKEMGSTYFHSVHGICKLD